MESMPDEVQKVQAETEKEKQNQHKVAYFFLKGYLFGHDIEGDEQENADPAVNIRPVIQSDMNLHIHQMAGNHIKDGKIRFQRFGEGDIAGGRHPKRIHFRNQNGAGQTSCQKRVEAETAETLQVIHSAHGRQNHLYDEIKDDTDADHDGNIIVG